MRNRRGIALVAFMGAVAAAAAVTVMTLHHKPALEQSSLKQDPLVRAKQLHEMGRFEEARKAYIEALAQDPNRIDALRGLAKLCRDTNDAPAAIPFLQRIVKLTPRDSAVHRDLALALERVGRLDEAMASAQIAQSLKTEPDPELENLVNRLVMRPPATAGHRPSSFSDPRGYAPKPPNPNPNDWIRRP